MVIVDLEEINWGHFWRQFFENSDVNVFSEDGRSQSEGFTTRVNANVTLERGFFGTPVEVTPHSKGSFHGFQKIIHKKTLGFILEFLVI